MNRTELAASIAREHGFTKALAGRVLSTVLDTIRAELIAGREVRVRGFGTFRARESHRKVRAKLDDSPHFFRVPSPSPRRADGPRSSPR